jgi:microsomal dipeptidase-like Zn-dependent dipeptidase
MRKVIGGFCVATLLTALALLPPACGSSNQAQRASQTSLRAAVTLDFEQGLTGWTKTGNAFDGQPLTGNVVLTTAAAGVPLGGDYWKSLPYPVGQHGSGWIGTALSATGGAPDEAPTGTLASDDFTLSPDSRYLSFLVGAGGKVAEERIELEVRAATPDEAAAIEALRPQPWPEGVGRDGDYVPYYVATGDTREDLQWRVQPIPPALDGKRARIRVVDQSSTGHINVDYILMTAEQPPPFYGEVWGFGEFHAHPLQNHAFGGLNGVATIWGVPGRRAADYAANPDLFRRDMPLCDPHHLGGRLAPWVINEAENRLEHSQLSSVIHNAANRDHDSHGGDPEGGGDFGSFPSYRSGAHHQYHITQIRRAFDGGLRLLLALAVNNPGAEFGMLRPEDGPDGLPVIRLTSDLDVIRAHVCAMRQLERLNQDWMEIAYTPTDARRIIHAGKLAVVLGAEVDRLGDLLAVADDEVALLHSLGLRHILPVHAVDNRLGGACLFQPLYNTLNDYLHRPANSAIDDPSTFRFFQLTDGGCDAGLTRRGECVLFRYAASQDRGQLVIPSLLGDAITLADGEIEPYPFRTSVVVPDYQASKAAGHLNANGLTPDGKAYIEAMMRRGMIVDIAHMSDQSVSDAFIQTLPRGGYPLTVSHVGFRQQMFHKDYSDLADDFTSYCMEQLRLRALLGPAPEVSDPKVRDACQAMVHDYLQLKGLLVDGRAVPGTATRGFLPKEFDLSTKQAQALAQLGGTVGLFAAQDPIDSSQPGPPFVNDCAESSKGFVAAYALGTRLVGNVGLATDFLFHATVNPRFGPNACSNGYLKAAAPDQQALRGFEMGLNPGQFQIGAQRSGVRYTSDPKPGVDYGSNEPLHPYRMANREFDFNVDGMANFGLVPDLLQDAKNVTGGGLDLRPFFASAESYIAMWEKAWRLAPCDAKTCAPPPADIDCQVACKNKCPDSWNAGAPLHTLQKSIARCSGRSVRLLMGAPIIGNGSLTSETEWALSRLPESGDGPVQLGANLFAVNIHWACDDSEEAVRCPNGTNYVRLKRGFGRALYVHCMRSTDAEAPPPAPAPPPASTWRGAALLDQRTDRCGGTGVQVITGTRVEGPWHLTDTTAVSYYAVPSVNVYWWCEDNPWSHEGRTICPAGTDYVRVQRGDARALYVDCLNSRAARPGPSTQSDPLAGAAHLEDETDRCGRTFVRVTTGTRLAGPERLADTTSSSVYQVSSKEIHWSCEDSQASSDERTVCPDGTNLIRVRRGDDRLLSTECYRR